MSAKVYIGDLRSGSYLDRIREGLDYIQASRLISRSSRLFVKPNLTFPEFRPGVMTSVEAVEAAVIALKDYTPHLVMGDSDSGGYNPFSMDEVYGQIGMYDMAARQGVEVVNLSRLPRRSTVLSEGLRPLRVDLPVLLTDEIDLLVTIPVPKIHMNTGVSLTFKNQWGCIPDPNDRLRLHPQLARVVFEVNRAIHARIAVVDGRWGLNRSGPMRGDAVALDWTLVADDIGAGARVCCELMQVPLQRIAHLRYAESRGAIPDLSEVELNVKELTPFLRERFYLRRGWTDYPGLLAFRSRALAYLAYFSPAAGLLHRALYLFREPFYDYELHRRPPPGGSGAGLS